MNGSIVGAKAGPAPVVIRKLAAKPDPKPYSLKIIRMECFNPNKKTIIPFIPLRKDYLNEVDSIWTDDKPSMAITWGFVGDGRSNKFKIYAKFKFTDSNGNNVPVKVEASSGGSAAVISNEVTVAREKATSTNKSPVKTNTASFTFNSYNIKGFSKQDISFVWKYKDVNGSWVEIKTIPVTVYFIPAKPNLPWMITGKESNYNSNQNPWTAALDMLLGWGVEGKTSTTEISKQITSYVNSSISLEYDINRGASLLTIGDRGQFFDCSTFISSVGTKQIINCTDCATIVSTFANLLGANLYQVCFGKRDRAGFIGFFCNTIKAIGYEGQWQYPFACDKNGNRVDISNTKDAAYGTFAYHEIAFAAGKSYNKKIYDACLKVDNNAIKEGNKRGKEVGSLPADIQFATKNSYAKVLKANDLAYYRELLVLNNVNNLNNSEIVGYGYGINLGDTKGRRSLK